MIQLYDDLDLAAQYIKKASLAGFHADVSLAGTIDNTGRAIYGEYYGQYPNHHVLERTDSSGAGEVIFNLLNAWELFKSSGQDQAQAKLRALLVELSDEEHTAKMIEEKEAAMEDTETQAKRKAEIAQRIREQQDADMLAELHRERLAAQAERMVQDYVDTTDRYDEAVRTNLEELEEQLDQARRQAEEEAVADEAENPDEFSDGEIGDSVFSDVDSVDDTASDYST